MFTMSIVLPRRRRKHDIFAPRKSIQDAKEKLGPSFFDPTLLECSRNAVALNKLVDKWEHIDKERVKFLRNLTREQNFLRSSYKTHKIRRGSGTSVTAVDSTQQIETNESRQIIPGFRYKSNGDLKQSCSRLPIRVISRNDELGTEETEDSEKELQDYDSVDYRKEIKKLQNVIIDICRELIRSKTSLNQANSTYLRAHSNEYVSISDLTGEMYQYDRFAYQPGPSSLHKLTTKTPSSRSCIGCQFKLRQPIDNFTLHLKRDSDFLKRRWSYVPSGKYVESSTILRPTDSSLAHHASEDLESSKSSPDHLRTDSEIVPRKAVSFKEPQNKKTYFGLEKRPTSCPSLAKLNKQKDASWVSAPILKDKKLANAGRDIPASPTDGDNSQPSSATGSCLQGRSESRNRDLASSASFRSDNACIEIPGSPTDAGNSLPSSAKGSGLRGRSRSRDLASSTSFRNDIGRAKTSSRMLADFDSRLCLLKAYQADQAKMCDSKVSQFIKELDSSNKGKTT